MEENLVIVESPAKAKTIEKFLGKNYIVKSSYGHIRDLAKKDFGVDIKNSFEPAYEISSDKKKIVAELKKLSKSAKKIWLASDEDREGEAIAWHLAKVLNLDASKTKRIVFHEITKDAIQNAIKKPRDINIDLVNAQQARRILDRLVGFELSPLLWKKVKPSLSAGRVQSVAVRLIVERERDIRLFKPISSYKTTADFLVNNTKTKITEFKADLYERFKNKQDVSNFLELCKTADFVVDKVTKKPTKKSPAPPFTTSTLQQEASRKFGFSVSQTMTVAQKLYEAGFITYMRTDSVNLSNLALNATKNEVIKLFGENYSNTRKYKTKIKGAQEAHEAIRPTYISNHSIKGGSAEQKLYELIWKRTIASQMSDAQLEKTTVKINVSNSDHQFVANGEVIKFEGFLKVYLESTDEEQNDTPEGMLPKINSGDILEAKQIKSIQKYSYPPARFTEASLVKKMEELGIGRPSTYAPTISTIQNRGYVVKEDRQGKERTYNYLELIGKKITDENRMEITGTEKAKMFPTDIGIVVNDFLLQHFDDIVDFNFTAKVEKDFDDIAEGKIVWQDMLGKFYFPFHDKVEHTIENSDRSTGERKLGADPSSGKPIIVRIGRYGPMAQIGDSEDEEKPRFARLQKGQHLETITLDEALKLFELPREIGLFEETMVAIGIGRFGPYVKHKNKFVSLKKGVDDPYTIQLERAIELINEKREKDKNKLIKSFDQDSELLVLNGRYGPYISYKKLNYRIPKTNVPSELSFKDCLELISKSSNKKKPKKASSKKKS